MTEGKTDERILAIARELLASGGVSAVSFDAIARQLDRSKQAVLYWYPTKQDLLAAMFLPWLNAETDVAVEALARASGRDAAVRAFVTAVAAFHLDDLDRFRMMYLLPQTTGGMRSQQRMTARVHPVTDRLYTTLAAHLGGKPEEARREAFAIHSAVLGLVLMHGLADSLDDPLKHSDQAAIDALAASLCGSERP